MHGLGIIQNYDRLLESYEECKEVLLDYIRSEAFSQSDIDDLISKRGKSRGCQAEAQRRLTSVGKDGMSMQFGTASRDPR
jgi:hypothetical protein